MSIHKVCQMMHGLLELYRMLVFASPTPGIEPRPGASHRPRFSIYGFFVRAVQRLLTWMHPMHLREHYSQMHCMKKVNSFDSMTILIFSMIWVRTWTVCEQFTGSKYSLPSDRNYIQFSAKATMMDAATHSRRRFLESLDQIAFSKYTLPVQCRIPLYS